MTVLLKTIKVMMRVENLDEETTRMVERMVILRLSTKHVNLWIRQLEMKRSEICELAGLMKLEKIKEEIQKERSLERWAKRCTHHFTKKEKRMMYEEIDNMVWSGTEKEITQWCRVNEVNDAITEDENEEIWMRETPDDEDVRLNGNINWRLGSACVTSSTHTKTSSPSHSSANIVL